MNKYSFFKNTKSVVLGWKLSKDFSHKKTPLMNMVDAA